MGMAALLPAIPARADLDDVFDELFAPFVDAASSTLDWGALSDSAAWETFFDPAHWEAAWANLDGLGEPLAALASPVGLTDLFDQWIYTPIHTGVGNLLDSDFGQQVGGVVNQLLGSYAIGDGADGTAENPDGGAGGWLFGDGGAGYSSSAEGVAGGAGGAAGWFGNGGAGGDGGEGAAGGAGGNGGWLLGVGGVGGDGGDGVVGGIGGSGGAGGWLFGIGGAGGSGGDGGDGGHGGDGGSAIGLFGSGGAGGDGGDSGVGGSPTRLPALGGTGGNGSLFMFGAHGDVGQFGTGVPLSGGTGGFSTAGSWLIDSDGRVGILHGLDHVNKVAPYELSVDGFGADDAAFLAANGFNNIQLGLIWAAVEPEPGVYDYDYLASVAQTVQTLSAHGVTSNIYMHQDLYGTAFGGVGAPDWAVQTGGLPNNDAGFPWNYFVNAAGNHAWDAFWGNAKAPDGIGLENHYAQMIQVVAHYFKDEPGVAAFGVIAEPHSGSHWLPSLLGSPYFDSQQLTPFYNQTIAAIRSVDPDTPIFVQPNVLFNLGVPTQLGAIDDEKTIFSFQNFCPTSDLLGINLFCDVFADMALATAARYADEHDIPSHIGGFGNSNIPEVHTALTDAANRHQYGWATWTYTGQNNNMDIPVPARAASLVYNTNLPPTGDNIDAAKLAVLAEPYPQAVSGIPNAWSFDNGTFQLSYSTEMANGQGVFAAGAQSNIAVPAVIYPNGYDVTVTGGQVVSAPNASVLVIASDPGATTISVTVTRAEA
ncbi:hypothetical protein AWC02_19660 [Mycolicibacter engbaekii]|uniref:Endoglycoceramidase n=2 Tax=Mycolicibacter engbaekii TaxID=188915 RepID=A0A1X1T525_9MYCO|nr:hypothetical protein AWC02_19660 [Mycolicibacter engbaekii]